MHVSGPHINDQGANLSKHKKKDACEDSRQGKCSVPNIDASVRAQLTSGKCATLFKGILVLSYIILLHYGGTVRGGNIFSSNYAEQGSGQGRSRPLMPLGPEADPLGPSMHPSHFHTESEREFARADRIVDMVKNNDIFTRIPLLELRDGPEPVRELFSAHLTGHVQARLLAGAGRTGAFYHEVVRPKMWEFTTQHFVPILRRRVNELRRNLDDETADGPLVIKARIRQELPTFDSHDRAMQYAVDEEVRLARLAAIRNHDPHPEQAARRKLQQVSEWRLTRAEYDDMAQFVDRSIDHILTRRPTEQAAAALFDHLHA